MRDELHLMELVDRYLDGSMNAEERTVFEARAKSNADLRELIEDQRALREGVARAHARAAATKAYRSYRFGKPGPWIGGAVVVAVIGITAAMLMLKHEAPTHEAQSDAPAATIEETIAATEDALHPLVINVDTRRDTTVLSPGGIVLDIPRGCFTDSLGRTINGSVQVTLKEALTAIDIIKAGLSTMSGDTLLETGGMFHIDARKDGRAVRIDPSKPITAMVPASTSRTQVANRTIEEARVRHILLSANNGKSDQSQRYLADSLVRVLKRDRNQFNSLAERYSDDPASKNSGGIYDWFDQQTMVPEFTAASFGQPIGSISICKTEYGHHIVEVLDRRSRTIPGSEVSRSNMMLYRGEELPDGRIDWRDPQPLKKSLVPVDITTLNFYPPGYEQKLAELGQDVERKAFRDSLYWSFSYTTSPQRRAVEVVAQKRDVWPVSAGTGSSDLAPTTIIPDSATNDPSESEKPIHTGSNIDPAKVKTIWQPRFNGTNLATREFEERMRAIHGTCDNEVLDLYAKNLDKDLSELDARAARRGHSAFTGFAKRNDGKVDLPKHAAERLRAVYENWSRAEAEAIRKAQEKFWSEQAKEDATANQRRAQQSNQEVAREAELFRREYEANLAEACRQLGIEKLGPRREPPMSAYVANVTNPGWWNVDRAVFQATADRRDMRFTDQRTGKTATLTYTPLTVEVSDRASYDEIFVYLIPQELNSFQRMNERNGIFEERLNDQLTNDVLCLGMKGAQQFAFTTKASGQSRITATLSPTDDNGLRAMLRTKDNVEESLLDESRYLIWSATDRARQKRNADRTRLRQELLPVVFPCANSEAKESISPELIEAAWADFPARFPGGEEAMWAWLRERMKVPSIPGGDGRVVVNFIVEADGRTTNHSIARSGGAACDAEALRVVRQFPRWEPSRNASGPVACRIQVPVNFSLD